MIVFVAAMAKTATSTATAPKYRMCLWVFYAISGLYLVLMVIGYFSIEDDLAGG